MAEAKRRLGIFGGTFDPPHLGHLAMASAALEMGKLDEVRLVVAGEPWQKGGAITHCQQRLAMTQILCAGVNGLVVDSSEVFRDGPSYTVDTLESLANDASELFLILGADAFATLDSWRNPDQIRELASFVVLPRRGIEINASPGMTVLATPTLDISSSQIRELVRLKQPIDHLTGKDVSGYIHEAGLYR